MTNNTFDFNLDSKGQELLSNCMGTMIYGALALKNLGYKDDDICPILSTIFNIDIDPDASHKAIMAPIMSIINTITEDKGNAESFLKAYRDVKARGANPQ